MGGDFLEFCRAKEGCSRKCSTRSGAKDPRRSSELRGPLHADGESSIGGGRMIDEVRSGVLVVGHGSRREEANRDVRDVARKIGERGPFQLVEAAFLEIEQPDIAEGYKRLVQRGARTITV